MFLKHIDGALRLAFQQQSAPNTMNLLGQKIALKADRLRLLSARSLREIAWICKESSQVGDRLPGEMLRMDFSGDNEKLADSCQMSKAACCKKGKIFLPKDQYQKILQWLHKNSNTDEVKPFKSRCLDNGLFYLYDQQNCCQFLDHQNLCRLHVDGVKPLECFWWPLHVYVDDQGSLFVGAADYCCSGCGVCDVADHIKQIEHQADAISKEVIKAFREVFPGSNKYKTLKVLG